MTLNVSAISQIFTQTVLESKEGRTTYLYVIGNEEIKETLMLKGDAHAHCDFRESLL